MAQADALGLLTPWPPRWVGLEGQAYPKDLWCVLENVYNRQLRPADASKLLGLPDGGDVDTHQDAAYHIPSRGRPLLRGLSITSASPDTASSEAATPLGQIKLESRLEVGVAATAAAAGRDGEGNAALVLKGEDSEEWGGSAEGAHDQVHHVLCSLVGGIAAQAGGPPWPGGLPSPAATTSRGPLSFGNVFAGEPFVKRFGVNPADGSVRELATSGPPPTNGHAEPFESLQLPGGIALEPLHTWTAPPEAREGRMAGVKAEGPLAPEEDAVLQALRDVQVELGQQESQALGHCRRLHECVMLEWRASQVGNADAMEREHLRKWGEIMAALQLQREEAEKQSEDDETQNCCICGGGDCTHQDKIAFCDRCDVPIHQSCYSIGPLPRGNYYCRPCAVQVARGNAEPCSAHYPPGDRGDHDVECELCPERGSAYSPTDLGPGKWCHTSCAKFQNVPFHEGRAEISRLLQRAEASPPEQVCVFCQREEPRHRAALRRCADPRCQTFLHPLCGKKRGGALDGAHNVDPAHWKVWCPRHSNAKKRRPNLYPHATTPEQANFWQKGRDLEKEYQGLRGNTAMNCHPCKNRKHFTIGCTNMTPKGPCTVRYCGTCIAKHFEDPREMLKNPDWKCYVCRRICKCARPECKVAREEREAEELKAAAAGVSTAASAGSPLPLPSTNGTGATPASPEVNATATKRPAEADTEARNGDGTAHTGRGKKKRQSSDGQPGAAPQGPRRGSGSSRGGQVSPRDSVEAGQPLPPRGHLGVQPAKARKRSRSPSPEEQEARLAGPRHDRPRVARCGSDTDDELDTDEMEDHTDGEGPASRPQQPHRAGATGPKRHHASYTQPSPPPGSSAHTERTQRAGMVHGRGKHK